MNLQEGYTTLLFLDALSKAGTLPEIVLIVIMSKLLITANALIRDAENGCTESLTKAATLTAISVRIQTGAQARCSQAAWSSSSTGLCTASTRA